MIESDGNFMAEPWQATGVDRLIVFSVKFSAVMFGACLRTDNDRLSFCATGRPCSSNPSGKRLKTQYSSPMEITCLRQ